MFWKKKENKKKVGGGKPPGTWPRPTTRRPQPANPAAQLGFSPPEGLRALSSPLPSPFLSLASRPLPSPWAC